MLPDPLHPLVVHFPIVLAVALPLFAAAGFWAISTGRFPRRSWLAVLALQVLLLGSGWLAMESGEHEEERVERIVGERPLESHEEAAERFLTIVALGLPLSLAGLLSGRVGAVNRGLVVVVALIALVAVGETGRLGGALVYEHGAASAYAGAHSPAPALAAGGERNGVEDDDD